MIILYLKSSVKNQQLISTFNDCCLASCLFIHSALFNNFCSGLLLLGCNCFETLCIIIFLLESFSHQRLLKVFHWNLSDSKSPQVSRTLLSILPDLNNAVVWTVSTGPVISKFSSPCTNPLVTVTRTPITIDITVTFMCYSFFFQFICNVVVLTCLFAFFQFYTVVRWDSKIHNFASSLFFMDYYKV